MSDVLTSLTAVAVSVFRAQEKPAEQDLIADWLEFVWTRDAVLRDAQRKALIVPSMHPELATLADELFAEEELASLAPKAGELDPMILHPGGGARMSPMALVTGLLTAALLQIYFFRLRRDEGTFVRTVLEGFEELRRAARGEPVRAHFIVGVGGLVLQEGRQVTTPWGILRPAPEVAQDAFDFPPRIPTTCVLSEARLLPIRVDRAASPEGRPEGDIGLERFQVLFPLTCALASPDATSPAVPLVTWSTVLLPFGHGLGYSMPYLPPRLKPAPDITQHIGSIEEWGRTVEASHTTSVDLAARRLVSAAAHRMDWGDMLIDAVMAWENLVGSSTEVTFRVTAALSKLLEAEPGKRRALRKSLASVYDVRSRLVHGVAIEPKLINQAAIEAVSVAIQALRASYRRGQAWLELRTTERSDKLLLEEP